MRTLNDFTKKELANDSFRGIANQIKNGDFGVMHQNSEALINSISENKEEWLLLQTLKHLVKLEAQADLKKQIDTFYHTQNLEY